jgi:hypothetical protein
LGILTRSQRKAIEKEGSEQESKCSHPSSSNDTSESSCPNLEKTDQSAEDDSFEEDSEEEYEIDDAGDQSSDSDNDDDLNDSLYEEKDSSASDNEQHKEDIPDTFISQFDPYADYNVMISTFTYRILDISQRCASFKKGGKIC